MRAEILFMLNKGLKFADIVEQSLATLLRFGFSSTVELHHLTPSRFDYNFR